MLSVICIYNDEKIFNDCLSNSLLKQTVKYDGIFINNVFNSYSCAAKALNEFSKMAICDYIIYIHQDIIIDDIYWLENLERSLNNLKNIGVVGIAGCKDDDKYVYTNVMHGDPKIHAGKYRIMKPIEAQTVDELLFIIPKIVYKNIKFDEESCFDWHLYAVDFCLECKLKGYNVYVIPTEIYHKSTGGSMSIKYYYTIKKLHKKYKNSYSSIRTTCSYWNFNNFYINYYYVIFKYILKSYLKKLINY